MSERFTSRRKMPLWAIGLILVGAIAVMTVPPIVVVAVRSAHAAAREKEARWDEMIRRQEQLAAWRKRADEIHDDVRVRHEALEKARDSNQNIENVVNAKARFTPTPEEEAELADLLLKISRAEAQEKAQRATQ